MEVEQAANESGFDFAVELVRPENENGFYRLRYAEICSPVGKANAGTTGRWYKTLNEQREAAKAEIVAAKHGNNSKKWLELKKQNRRSADTI